MFVSDFKIQPKPTPPGPRSRVLLYLALRKVSTRRGAEASTRTPRWTAALNASDSKTQQYQRKSHNHLHGRLDTPDRGPVLSGRSPPRLTRPSFRAHGLGSRPSAPRH